VDGWMSNRLTSEYGITTVAALSELVSDNPAYKASALIPRLVYDAKDTVELSRMNWRDVKVFTRLHTAKAIPFESRKNRVPLVLPKWCPSGTEAKYLAYVESREKDRHEKLRREREKRALLSTNRVRERRASCVADFSPSGLDLSSMMRRPSVVAEDFTAQQSFAASARVGDENGGPLRSPNLRNPITRIKSKLKMGSASTDDL